MESTPKSSLEVKGYLLSWGYSIQGPPPQPGEVSARLAAVPTSSNGLCAENHQGWRQMQLCGFQGLRDGEKEPLAVLALCSASFFCLVRLPLPGARG